MCVIIHQPKGSHLDKETAERAWSRNPDGGGFAFIKDNGEIHVEKHMEFAPFWRAFERARSDFPRRDYLLHMRIATHGSVTTANVHPFFLNEQEQTVVAHNGIFHRVPDYNDGRSDTRVFIDEVLPLLPTTWLDSSYLTDMVEEWMGWSKLVFLTNDPALERNVYILNAHKGETHQGMWFSNESYKEPKNYSTKTTLYPLASREYKSWWQEEDDKMSDWQQDQISRYKAVHIIPELPTETEDEPITLERVREKLTDAREASWLMAEIFYDNADDEWLCFGCDEVVDIIDGECQCWMKVCLDCARYAAECLCGHGGSVNLTMYEDADKEVQKQAEQFVSLR